MPFRWRRWVWGRSGLRAGPRPHSHRPPVTTLPSIEMTPPKCYRFYFFIFFSISFSPRVSVSDPRQVHLSRLLVALFRGVTRFRLPAFTGFLTGFHRSPMITRMDRVCSVIQFDRRVWGIRQRHQAERAKKRGLHHCPRRGILIESNERRKSLLTMQPLLRGEPSRWIDRRPGGIRR